MNIAHFTSAYYPSHGGVQEFVRQLAGQQRLEGGRPLIVTNRWPKDLPAAEVHEGVPVVREVFRVPEPNWRQLPGAALFGPATEKRLVRSVQAHGADVIHIQCVSSNAYYAMHIRRRLNLPLVATLHGELSVDDGRSFQQSRFARDLLREVLRTADAITACSVETLREAEEFFGQPLADKAQVIYNGVRAEDFIGVEPYAHPRPYILALGRHVRQKGFDILLRAFAKVRRVGFVSHDLLIAGDGPQRATLERLCAGLGINDCVRFIGATDRATTARLFVGCSFFVLPSRMEPLGIVNLEAMACGKAVLASDVGGVAEVVQNERTGILIDPTTIDGLAVGMIRLIGSPLLCTRLGVSGRKRVLRFSWQAAADQYRCIYEAVKNGHGHRNMVAA